MWDDGSFESRSFEPGSWLFNFVQAAAGYLRAVRLTVRTGIASAVTSSKAMTATVRRKPGG